jgi:hypothetical protein
VSIDRATETVTLRHWDVFHKADRAGKSPLSQARAHISKGLIRSLLSKLAVVVTVVGLLDSVSFSIGASYLGGDAVNVKIDGRRYYLYGPYHGMKGYHEVSQAVFDYSKWHAYSLIIWPLMIVSSIAAELAAKRVNC